MTTTKDILKKVVSYEPYETTCTREVASGTRNVCHDGRTERRCRKISGVGEECWEETESVCSEETQYETESYSCTKYDKVVDYVFDYKVSANIEVIKSAESKKFDLNNCRFGVELNASDETYYALCMNALVRFKILSRQGPNEINSLNKSKDQERNIKILLDFSSILQLNALKHGLEKLTFEKGIVSFLSSNLKEYDNYKLIINLKRNRFLLKDKVISNKELNKTDFELVKILGDKSLVSFNMAKITGNIDTSKKHTVKISLQTHKTVDLQGVINRPSLQNAVSDTFIIND